ncbi:MAG: energy transducer TonB [Gammaproteobacteria bacterium]|nr:energy transducer TonB [Gammaproteobacteria bacterium]
MLLRYTSAVLLGTVATFGLLTLMRSVIADPLPAEDSGIKGEVLEIVRLVEERKPILKSRNKPEPPPPYKPPPQPPREKIDGPTIGIDWEPLEPTQKIGGILGNRYLDDGEYLPIVRVSPIYPRRALTRGIEGYVLVEFVVTETGSVRDPVVLFADPPGFFERAAVTAVLKFKYKPKVTGGKPVAVAGVRSRIVFEMEE